jgi:tRNA U34 5-methylaminomethyl-2-thiouridine-forming methyltransferase MnmC
MPGSRSSDPDASGALGTLVETQDGSFTLSHPEHGETYHSAVGARAEARRLYIEASGILERFAADGPAVRVLDVGLGLAYNAVTTIAAWRAAPAPPDLALVSLENVAPLAEALASGAAAWTKNWETDDILLGRCLRKTTTGYAATVHHPTGRAVCDWTVAIGDARATPLDGRFAFIWQDPFSPAKNPDMWDAAWFARLAAHAAPGAVLMSYSVARAVRDALAQAGFAVERIPTGTGIKRHWLRARLPS